MPNESSQGRQASVRAHIRLLELADEGKLEGLPCPKCNDSTVSVWFKEWERILFKCEKCDFDSLAIASEKPKFYSKERDLWVEKELAATRV